jgi:hypothetical protein
MIKTWIKKIPLNYIAIKTNDNYAENMRGAIVPLTFMLTHLNPALINQLSIIRQNGRNLFCRTRKPLKLLLQCRWRRQLGTRRNNKGTDFTYVGSDLKGRWHFRLWTAAYVNEEAKSAWVHRFTALFAQVFQEVVKVTDI